MAPTMFHSLKTCAVVAAMPAAALTVSNPGAGMTKPEDVKPFKDLHKDGYSYVDCVLDDMLLHGDKHGDNKAAYTAGTSAGVSIVHYTDVVAKMDRKPMTQKVCYDFCRTVKDMGFFGIHNGRDCYCSPYFKMAPADSSTCDAPCDGDPGTMCGGKVKSAVFSMHFCDQTEDNFNKAKAAADKVADGLGKKAKLMKFVGSALQGGAAKAQAAFGKVGDSFAAGVCQFGKESAGKMVHGADDAIGAIEQLSSLPSFSSDVVQAEKDTAKILEVTEKGEKAMANLNSMDKWLWFGNPADDNAKLYYPGMYFVDKKFENVPQTCGGEVASGEGMIGSYEECATGCNAQGSNNCVGFQFFPGPATKGACQYLRSVTSITYYTGCGKSAFLQGKTELDPVKDYKCALKFSEFNGLDLTPDKSGKNKMSLKDLKKADRCFV